MKIKGKSNTRIPNEGVCYLPPAPDGLAAGRAAAARFRAMLTAL